MATHSRHGCSTIKIRRPRITTSGVLSDLDPAAKKVVDQLNTLLSKAVFSKAAPVGSLAAMAVISGGGGRTPAVPQPVDVVLRLPLTAKHSADDNWADASLADFLNQTDDPKKHETLAHHINATSELSKLKYAFTDYIQDQRHTLPANIAAVLVDYPAITDYLVAYGYYVLDLKTKEALCNVLLNNPDGVQRIINYAAVSAARKRIFQQKLHVKNLDQDGGAVEEELIKANLPLSASFGKSADAAIRGLIFNTEEHKLLKVAEQELGEIPEALHGKAIQLIKNWPSKVTNNNVAYVVSPLLGQHASTGGDGEEFEDDIDLADDQFEVRYLEDDRELIQVSQSAVNCAAQLFYGMVLGDELDLFSVVNFFTHRYLVRGAIDITKHSLRNDLEAYVFNDKFSELDRNGKPTGRLLDRTRPAERQMFYRQVFNYGAGSVSEDVVVNTDFKRLWHVLMLESARYLERAQASPNPDSFVSRTNVMQAVEDLQYNLSTSCTGMATVITPLIYKELDFVVRRIFMNSEVMSKVAPGAGSWSRVVENLYMEMKRTRPKAAVLFNKAKLGHLIIQSIAGYTSDTFENEAEFSDFIGSVDAFITTQSILQQSLSDEDRDDVKMQLEEDDDFPSARPNGNGSMHGYGANGHGSNGYGPNGYGPNGHGYAGAPSPTASGADEWDF